MLERDGGGHTTVVQYLGLLHGLVVRVVSLPVAWLTARPMKPRAVMQKVVNLILIVLKLLSR